MSNLLDVLNQKPFSSMDTIDLNSSHIITKLTKDSIHCEINQSKPLQPPFTNCAHQTPENRRFRETTERITIQIIAGHPQQEKSTKKSVLAPEKPQIEFTVNPPISRYSFIIYVNVVAAPSTVYHRGSEFTGRALTSAFKCPTSLFKTGAIKRQ